MNRKIIFVFGVIMAGLTILSLYLLSALPEYHADVPEETQAQFRLYTSFVLFFSFGAIISFYKLLKGIGK